MERGGGPRAYAAEEEVADSARGEGGWLVESPRRWKGMGGGKGIAVAYRDLNEPEGCRFSSLRKMRLWGEGG